MSKKTYGVNGYIEWVANISVGAARLQVPFTGGATTKYGIVPAEYVTSDPVIQSIIENSVHYRSKRIFRIKEEPDASPARDKAPETVKVGCLADAAGVLRDRFRVPTVKITSAEVARRIGMEHNIRFTGI